LILWALLSGIGVTLLAAGWLQVRNENVYADQAAGINMAIAGVVVAGAGAISMLLGGRRAIVIRRLAVLGDLRGLPVRVAAGPSGNSTSQSLVGGEAATFSTAPVARWRRVATGAPRPAGSTSGPAVSPVGVCQP